MFKKIVVGMDLSEASILALEQVVPIARHMGAEVVMLHVGEMIDSRDVYPWISEGVLARYKELVEAEQARTRARLEDIRERHDGQGVTISQALISGNPESALAEAADELGADLIAVGSHSRKGFDHFLLGSVAARVSRFTSTDVLVSRNGGPPGVFKRILLPTDFSAAADRALECALELAAPEARLTLLHCWRLPAAIAGFSAGDLMAEIESTARAQLEETARKPRMREDISIDVEVVNGYAAASILERAADADLVAMGSHGRRGLRRFVLGSVAEKVVRHAKCSVFIARAEALEA